MEITLVLLASLWIGALVVLLFVQADELRCVRTELAVERERNRRDYVPLAPPAGTGKSDMTADVAESIREATFQGWMGEWIGGEK